MSQAQEMSSKSPSKKGAPSTGRAPELFSMAGSSTDSMSATANFISTIQTLTRPGQTLAEAMKESAVNVQKELDHHFQGWTPQLHIANRIEQHKRLTEETVERKKAQTLRQQKKVKSLEEVYALAKAARAEAQTDYVKKSGNDERDEEDEARASSKPAFIEARLTTTASVLPEEAPRAPRDLVDFEPGSLYWNPDLLLSDVQDVLTNLNTNELQEIIHEQTDHLEYVKMQHQYLNSHLAATRQSGEDLHNTTNALADSVLVKISKADKKAAKALEGCEAKSREMAANLRSAVSLRDSLRKQLMNDSEIVVTDEKKALLEDRRRAGQELVGKLIELQHKEEGYSGSQTPPMVRQMRQLIEKKEANCARWKLKVEQIQHHKMALEQALFYLDDGKLTSGGDDAKILEIIEEAQSLIRQQIIAPMIAELDSLEELKPPEKINFQVLLDEKAKLIEEIEQVKAESLSIKSQIEARQASLNMAFVGRRRSSTIRQMIQVEEQRVTNRYLLQGTTFKAAPMPEIDVNRAEQLKAGMRSVIRNAHREMYAESETLKKQYAVILSNVKASAAELQAQRHSFVSFAMSLTLGFFKEFTSAKRGDLLTDEDKATLAEEEELLKEVELDWKLEQERLAEGVAALDERAKFFTEIESQLMEDLEKLQFAIERNRLAVQDKLIEQSSQPAAKTLVPRSLDAIVRRASMAKNVSKAAPHWKTPVRRMSFIQAIADSQDEEDKASPEELLPFISLQGGDERALDVAAAAYRKFDMQVLQDFVAQGKKVEDNAKRSKHESRHRHKPGSAETGTSVASSTFGTSSMDAPKEHSLELEGSQPATVPAHSGSPSSPHNSSSASASSPQDSTLPLQERLDQEVNSLHSSPTEAASSRKARGSTRSSVLHKPRKTLALGALKEDEAGPSSSSTNPRLSRIAGTLSNVAIPRRNAASLRTAEHDTPKSSKSVGRQSMLKGNSPTKSQGTESPQSPLSPRVNGARRKVNPSFSRSGKSGLLSSPEESPLEYEEASEGQASPLEECHPDDREITAAIAKATNHALRNFLNLQLANQKLAREASGWPQKLDALKKNLAGQHPSWRPFSRQWLEQLDGTKEELEAAEDIIQELKQQWSELIQRRLTVEPQAPQPASRPTLSRSVRKALGRTKQEAAVEECYIRLLQEMSAESDNDEDREDDGSLSTPLE